MENRGVLIYRRTVSSRPAYYCLLKGFLYNFLINSALIDIIRYQVSFEATIQLLFTLYHTQCTISTLLLLLNMKRSNVDR